MNSSITRKKTEGFFNRRNGHLIYDIFVIAMLALGASRAVSSWQGCVPHARCLRGRGWN